MRPWILEEVFNAGDLLMGYEHGASFKEYCCRLAKEQGLTNSSQESILLFFKEPDNNIYNIIDTLIDWGNNSKIIYDIDFNIINQLLELKLDSLYHNNITSLNTDYMLTNNMIKIFGELPNKRKPPTRPTFKNNKGRL